MSHAMILNNGLSGGLGNLDAYITAASKVPVLSQQEEIALAERLRDNGDVTAAHRMVTSHLRVVISVARGYLGYGLPYADLIQEGNIGLMRAVKRYDPNRGVRLVSYAVYWIKASIHEYILKNWRLVKMATTRAQRKLFFGLRSHQNQIEQLEGKSATVAALAADMSVSEDEVRTMQERFAGGEVSFDQSSDSDDATFAPAQYLVSLDTEPTQRLAKQAYDHLQTDGLSHALAALDERSRRIIEARWLVDKGEARDEVQVGKGGKGGSDGGNGSGPMTLHDLAREFSISHERVRQIEVAALKKMRQTLSSYSDLIHN